MTDPSALFVSSHSGDRRLIQRLFVHLRPLVQSGSLRLLNSPRSANVILFLITPDYLADDRCTAQARDLLGDRDAGIRMLPAIIAPVDYLASPFGDVKPIFSPQRALVTWPHPDSAWARIAQAVRPRTAHDGTYTTASFTSEDTLVILSATADRHIKDQFLAHLAPLVREHRLQLWHRGMARPGQSVRSNAEAWLKLANHVLVLLSPDYLRSPLCTLLEKTAIDEGKIVHVAYIRPVAIVPPEAAKRLSSGTSALSERANQDQAYAERLSALVDSFDYWRTAGTRDSSEVS